MKSKIVSPRTFLATVGLSLLIPASIAFVALAPKIPIHKNVPAKTLTPVVCHGLSSSLLSASSISETENTGLDFVNPELLAEILGVATDAAKKAGDVILGNAGGAEVTERKANSRDLLTLIDPLCEKTIRKTVLDRFPDHDFLGEEDVSPGKEASAAAIEEKLNKSSSSAGGSDWLWIVDPIDGTTNFVHGMPLNMPSIAAAYKGRVVVGVIYDPHRDELFTATEGGGSFLNGNPITVGEQSELGDAVVAMGSPPGEESMKMSLIGVQALMPKVRTIRMLGSAAIMLAWIANGRLTAYWEYDLSSWDIAAGALIINEAGGNFTDLAGNLFTLRTRKIVASNGRIHDELLTMLNDAGVV
jgi:myo-inositol-1(or 4)-monophosphatase